MYQYLCSYKNLLLAYGKAKKGKTKKYYIKEFEKNLENNLNKLRTELLFHFYYPKLLKTFILRDPKLRKISKSAFRDRVVHHALINIIEPIFDKYFIYDSYANRKNKGNSFALKRLELFQRKVTKNYTKNTYCLRADIKHYFQEVNHNILLNIIKRKIKDERVMWLIKKIVNNISMGGGRSKKRNASWKPNITILCQCLLK